MTPRNTRTGSVLEQMILPSLEKGGYKYKTQVNIGKRVGGGKHIVDVIAQRHDRKAILISLKWQQVSGTAEQKIPYEVISLAEIIMHETDKYEKAYLVLGGSGWSLRDYYISGELDKHLIHACLVEIITLESFIALANKGKL